MDVTVYLYMHCDASVIICPVGTLLFLLYMTIHIHVYSCQIKLLIMLDNVSIILLDHLVYDSTTPHTSPY